MNQLTKFARFSISSLQEEDEDVTEQERLLKLYWNRAELKKEYAELRNERYQLQDQLKHQRAETLRVIDMLRSLENLLADREAAYNAIVHFQLKGLWRRVKDQLKLFASELQKQQEERESKAHETRMQRDREMRISEIKERIRKTKKDVEELDANLRKYADRAAQYRGIWNYFKRRRVNEKADELRVLKQGLADRVQELFSRRAELDTEQPAEYPGVSLEGRRRINIAVLALGQHLYLYCKDSGLADLVRSAQLKSVREVTYGNRSECDHLSEQIESAIAGIKSVKALVSDVKRRSDYLCSIVEYEKASAAIPSVSSVDGIVVDVPESAEQSAGRKVDVNILKQNFWDIREVLLS